MLFKDETYIKTKEINSKEDSANLNKKCEQYLNCDWYSSFSLNIEFTEILELFKNNLPKLYTDFDKVNKYVDNTNAMYDKSRKSKFKTAEERLK